MKHNETIWPISPLNLWEENYKYKWAFMSCFVSWKNSDIIFKLISNDNYKLDEETIKWINEIASHLFKFIPPTMILKLNSWDIMIQKRIYGKLCWELKLNELENKTIIQLITFLTKVLSFTISKWRNIDIWWHIRNKKNRKDKKIYNNNFLNRINDKIEKLIQTPKWEFIKSIILTSWNLMIEEWTWDVKFFDLTQSTPWNWSPIWNIYMKLSLWVFISSIIFQIGYLRFELLRRKISNKAN